MLSYYRTMHCGFDGPSRIAGVLPFTPLEVEFLVRVSQKTKFGAGFSSTFVFRHFLKFITRNLVPQLQRTSIISDLVKIVKTEMKKENQITITTAA